MQISNETVTTLGLYVLLPIFIATLLYIMWDVAKKSGLNRFGRLMAVMVLGAGFFVFIIKMIMELVFKQLLT